MTTHACRTNTSLVPSFTIHVVRPLDVATAATDAVTSDTLGAATMDAAEAFAASPVSLALSLLILSRYLSRIDPPPADADAAACFSRSAASFSALRRSCSAAAAATWLSKSTSPSGLPSPWFPVTRVITATSMTRLADPCAVCGRHATPYCAPAGPAESSRGAP